MPSTNTTPVPRPTRTPLRRANGVVIARYVFDRESGRLRVDGIGDATAAW